MKQPTVLFFKAEEKHLPKVKEIISLLGNLKADEAYAIIETVEHYFNHFAIIKTDNVDEFIETIYSEKEDTSAYAIKGKASPSV